MYTDSSRTSPLRRHLDKKHDTVTIVIAPHGRENPYRFNITRRLLKFVQFGVFIIFIASVFAVWLYLRNLNVRDQVSEIDAVWQNRMRLAYLYRDQLGEHTRYFHERGKDLFQHVWDEKPVFPEKDEYGFMIGDFKYDLIPLRTSLGFLMSREEVFRVMPKGMPLDNAYVSSLYGERISPFGSQKQFHTGVDFANAIGSPIKATADGVVIGVTNKNGPGLGIHAKVLHKYGFMTVYGHMSELLVEQDQVVKRGDTLGLLGQTGTATGPHLHYEVHLRHKTPVGPYSIILNPWLFVKEEL